MSSRLLLTVVLLWGASASAWESECAVDNGQYGRDTLQHLDNICHNSGLPACVQGMGAARGAQLGEHTLLALEAMDLAGIHSYVLLEKDVLRYFADRALPRAGSMRPTLEPAPPGAMSRGFNLPELPTTEARPVTLAEFAQVPDYSYSLADWLMGNEHCVALEGLEYSEAAMDACHTFRSHTSVVNSNHFLPQARVMYALYHSLALQVMDRCKAVHAALVQARTHRREGPFAGRWDKAVFQCEKEALALESLASHFLADAWSTGHMWQRWGSPIFPKPKDYVRTHLVGVMSGVIHGWRSVVEQYLGQVAPPVIHDQLSLPGPQPLFRSEQEAPPVEWTYPASRVPRGTDLTPRWGGGDLYLLECNGMPPYKHYLRRPSLTDSSPLGFQYRRMMTCLSRGFVEVYERGPRAHGNRIPLHDAELDPAIPPARAGDALSGALSPLCWEQRVTNRSMLQGTRAGPFAFSPFEPGVTGRAFHELTSRVGGNVAPDPTAAQRVVALKRAEQVTLVRAESIRLSAWMKVRAWSDPDGTDVADLEGPLVGYAGVGRNSSYTEEIQQGQVPYLERKQVSQWSATPGAPCGSDDECQRADPHTYCDRWARNGRALEPRCAPLETPVLRAFREAEMPYWCGGDDWDAVEAAREACQGRAANSPECVACLQVVAPRLRNACDPGPYGGLQSTTVPDPRSVCDHLKEGQLIPSAGVGVHWPYKPQDGETWEQASERAALEACQAGAQDTQPPFSIDYRYQADPPAQANLVSSASAGHTVRSGMCGRSETPRHWLRYRSTGDFNTTFRLELQTNVTTYFGPPQPVQRLAFEMFQGPRCDPSLDLLQSGTPVDTNGDGQADLLRMTWTVRDTGPDEVCIRISARDELVRTGWTYQRPFF
jgi:hypothetical protein